MSLRPRNPGRLSLGQFERWLATPAAQSCVHRRGRPGTGERPLVAEAARCFQVDRRTIERALVRLARRRRMLAEHQPVDAPTAALLLEAAKSFVVGDNATSSAPQMRQLPERGSQQADSAVKFGLSAPSRAATIDAVRALCQAGWFHPEDLQNFKNRTSDEQLQAVGLQTPVQTAPSKVVDALDASIAALLDAVDAVQSQLPSNHPVQSHLDAVRTALTPR
jgi:hypothetical protein